jgi:hypothetical protein
MLKLGLSGSTAIPNLHGQQLPEQRELTRVEQISLHHRKIWRCLLALPHEVNSVVETGKRYTARIFPVMKICYVI